jgi:hypothetical protein
MGIKAGTGDDKEARGAMTIHGGLVSRRAKV